MSSQQASAPAAPSNPVMSHRQILFVIFGLMAGMFLSALDQTVVGTAIRTIGDDLHGLSQQAWVTTAYLIVSTISTPIYGKLSDIFGRRPLFIFAIVIFIIGSILASFSTSMVELAVFRAIQGLGAGGLMSMPLAIMGDMLAPRERAKYQGYFLAVFGISSLIGPLVGGLFAGADQILGIAGWRWVFLINVPIGIVALLVVLRFLHLPKRTPASVRIDWWGATAVIVALVPLLLVAEEGRDWGWGSAGAIACYVIGAVGIIAFIFIEMAMKDDALIPLKLFGSSTFSMATIIGVFVGFGMFGAMLTLPLYLQLVLGSTPTESGFQTLPMILGLMISSIASGQIIARTGRYRQFPIIGTALLAGGFYYLTFLHYDVSYWFIAGAMLLIGLGLGQLMQTLTIASQNSVGLQDMGVATSSSTFFRQIGGTLGTAVLLSLLFAVFPTNLTNSLSDKATLTSALDAALTPSVASAPENKQIMAVAYDKIVGPITQGAAAGSRSVERRRPQGRRRPDRREDRGQPRHRLEFGELGGRQRAQRHVVPEGRRPAALEALPGGLQRVGGDRLLGGLDRRADRVHPDAVLQDAAAAGQVGPAGGRRRQGGCRARSRRTRRRRARIRVRGGRRGARHRDLRPPRRGRLRRAARARGGHRIRSSAAPAPRDRLTRALPHRVPRPLRAAALLRPATPAASAEPRG